jgi:hypothetical protein
MTSAIHSIGMSTVRSHLGASSNKSAGIPKASWLSKNREQVCFFKVLLNLGTSVHEFVAEIERAQTVIVIS